MTATPAVPDFGGAVDWRFAATVGGWLVRTALLMIDYTRTQVEAELRRSAAAAEPLVREVTGLVADGPVPDAQLVDRPQWIAAAAESMRQMTGGQRSGGGLMGRLAGAQTGALLAFVSSGILGQYDPFSSGGTLLLVYPNVVAIERRLGVEPSDFRLWVCLHEVTHRVQFAAAPWLADYMTASLAVLTDQSRTDTLAVLGRLAEHVRARRAGAEPAGEPTGILGLVRAVQSDEQRAALDRLLTLGTLLEGHADHVMDAVGPAAVPTVATIRARFDERRRRHQSPLQRLLRALLGIDAKLSQYTRGKAFVDEVVERVGMARFNTVFTDADTLPRPDEIEEPQRWIDRVL